MEDQLIRSIEIRIKNCARNFYNGHCKMISSRVSVEDLEQECYIYCIEKFRKSRCSVDDFRVKGIELKGVMCSYTQSQLAVRVPQRRDRYTQMMQKYGNAFDVEPAIAMVAAEDDSAYGRVLNDINVARFAALLDDKDKLAVETIVGGGDWKSVESACGFSKSGVYRAKNRIGKAFTKYMQGSA